MNPKIVHWVNLGSIACVVYKGFVIDGAPDDVWVASLCDIVSRVSLSVSLDVDLLAYCQLACLCCLISGNQNGDQNLFILRSMMGFQAISKDSAHSDSYSVYQLLGTCQMLYPRSKGCLSLILIAT